MLRASTGRVQDVSRGQSPRRPRAPCDMLTSTLKANEMHLSVVQMSAVKRLEHRTACAGALALVGLYIHLQVEQPVYVHDPGKGTTRESCRDPVHRTVSR